MAHAPKIIHIGNAVFSFGPVLFAADSAIPLMHASVMHAAIPFM